MVENIHHGYVIVVLHNLIRVSFFYDDHLFVVPDQVHDVEQCGGHPPPPLVVELLEPLEKQGHYSRPSPLDRR